MASILTISEGTKILARTRVALLLCTALVTLGACGRHRHREHVNAVPIAPSRVTQIGVNAWLWRASLDTIAFMPIQQVDSNGGVIVTDWYTNAKAPGERVKVTIYILDQDLRADAIRVAVQRQIAATGGGWSDAAVAAGTVQKLEETILGRARDLRRAASLG